MNENLTKLTTHSDLNREEAIKQATAIQNIIVSEDVVAFAIVMVYRNGTSESVVTKYDDRLRLLGASIDLTTAIQKSGK